MSDLVNKLQVIDPMIINNLLKLLQENASIQRLKSQLTDKQLYKIQKDREKMNEYEAGDPIQNIYQDILISRVANY